MEEKLIAIVTPVYNRADLIGNLYASLLRQEAKNFVWLIVDDGSTDGLKTVADGMIAEGKIPISCLYKSNGGKHTALNAC